MAALICRALDRCDAAEKVAIAKSLRRKGQFAWVARKVSPDEERRVRALEIKGIGFFKESRRFYPKRELLAHVLGYVGLDDAGLGGLESAYDVQVRGRAGRVLIQRDARRQALTSYVERESTPGAALELTIDQYLQHLAERALQEGVAGIRRGRRIDRGDGSGHRRDPRARQRAHVQSQRLLPRSREPPAQPRDSGPATSPDRRSRSSPRRRRSKKGSSSPEDLIDVSAGSIRFGSRQIDDVHRYGVLSFTDVIVKSSNVGAIKVGLKLGPERLGRYVSRFGFGQTLVPDFRGESPGIVWNPARLDPSAVASVSMGYQVGVTPVQMATAASSIANGGTLYEPRVVRAIIKDGQRVEVPHKALRRTVSERTSSQMTAIMEAVVEDGTGKAARIDGYTIAGKTGTAHKVINGSYSPSEYNASFVGFVPSRKPALTIIVVIDSPHGKGYFGGAVAAPIFKRVAEGALRHLGIAPTVNAPPPVLVAARSSDVEASGPRAAILPVNLDVTLGPARAGLMPDLRGLSARDANRALTRIGMTGRLNGDGFVLEQSPAAGSVLVPGGACVLTLGRQPPAGAPQ